jgi:hypothetical protein
VTDAIEVTLIKKVNAKLNRLLDCRDALIFRFFCWE